MSDTPTGPLILWLDYHTEGWKPMNFRNPDELLTYIREGQTHGQPFVITGATLALELHP